MLTEHRPASWRSLEAQCASRRGQVARVTQGSSVMRAEAWPQKSNMGGQGAARNQDKRHGGRGSRVRGWAGAGLNNPVEVLAVKGR